MQHVRFAAVALLAIVLSALPPCARAADAEEGSADGSEAGSTFRLEKGAREYGVWGGGAAGATTDFGGLQPDEAAGREFVIAGLRYGYVFANTRRAALEYIFDVIPVAISMGNPVETFSGNTTRESVYGLGFAPLGIKAIFNNGKRTKLFLSTTGGILAWEHPVPLPDSGEFTFTIDFDLGVHVLTRSRRVATFGIKFHHISNGGLEDTNRGVNWWVIYGGFSKWRGRPGKR